VTGQAESDIWNLWRVNFLESDFGTIWRRSLMAQDYSKRKSRTLTWVLVSSPYLLLLIFLALAVHVRVGFGHWPTPVLENYHTMACSLHEQVVIWVAAFTIFFAIPLWLISLLFRLFRISLKTHLIQAGAYVGGWAMLILYARVDPYRFVEWFFD